MPPQDDSNLPPPPVPSTDAPPTSGGTAGPEGNLGDPGLPTTRGTVGAAGPATTGDPTSYPGIGGDRPGVPTNDDARAIQSGAEPVDTSRRSTAKDEPNAPRATFTVSSPIEMDGERYEIGDQIELTEKDHRALAHAVRQPSPFDKPKSGE